MPSRYNLRKRAANTTWVKDETLKSESESDSSEDEDYEQEESEDQSETESESEEESEDEAPVIKLPKGSKVRVQLHIHTVASGKAQLQIGESESESESEEDEFISHLKKKYTGGGGHKVREDAPAIELNDDEEDYFVDLPKSKRRRLNEQMKRLSSLIEEGDVPFKFRVLELPIPDSLKAAVIKKVDILNEMDSSEGYKLRTWVESFLTFRSERWSRSR